MSLIAIITTLPTREQAQQLARALVERRLVACAQMETIESVYLWQGELQQEHEVRLTLKAPEAHRGAIEAVILDQHPYDLPAIHAIRPTWVYAPYGDWVMALTGEGAAANRAAEA